MSGVSSFPWLTTLGLIPLVGAVVVMLVPAKAEEAAKRIALIFGVAALALTIVIALRFEAGADAPYQFTESHSWIPSFGISYSVGVDGIALVLVALLAILVPIVMIAGWHDADHAHGSVKGYFALILVLETLMIGVFVSLDLFLFYVFFEVMLIPMYLLIGRYGGPQRNYAAVKFLLYSLAGGLLMLAALIGLYVVSGNELGAGTFDFQVLTELNITPGMQKVLFLGFFIAFAVKAPLWPLHTWLPDAAAESTPGSAVLMVGVMDKVGTFGMIRYCLELFPGASRYFTPVIIVMCVVGILYGALLAIGQTDLKRLIAYTSISHFGFIGLGIFAMTTQGQAGSALYMINHGFSTGALFLLVGYMMTRRGSRLVSDFGGMNKVAPVLAGLFLVAGLSSLALPGMSSFVSEFLVLVGTFERYTVAAVIATLGIILAALYILYLYQRTMTGPLKPSCEGITDLKAREVAAIAPLIAIIIGLGFFPGVALDVINPAVERTMVSIGATDPPPTVPPPTAALVSVPDQAGGSTP